MTNCKEIRKEQIKTIVKVEIDFGSEEGTKSNAKELRKIASENSFGTWALKLANIIEGK